MFWSRALISDDLAGWIDEFFYWYDERFGIAREVVLPSSKFFSAGKGRDLDTAKAVVADIKRLLGVAADIDLVPINNVPEEYRHSYQTLSAVAGTYQQTEGGHLISYDPEQMKLPINFISTMAHEVMHVRLNGLVDELPGGPEVHELATDLGAILGGFGAFQMQAADDIGWAGYMSQPARAYAMARFLERNGISENELKMFLSGRCYRLLKRAVKALAS